MKYVMDAAALDAAFRATIYRVEMPEGRFDLRIGVACPAFDDGLRARGIGRWGVITACNPGAVRLSDELNRLRQGQLCGRLKHLGRDFYAACNFDPEGGWPAEPGCLVLEIGQEPLRLLALEFLQLAVVCGESGSPPRLLWV